MNTKSGKTIPPTAGTPVLYIHPAKQGVGFTAAEGMGRPYGVIPVGVVALVNVLREHGINVRGINYPLEKQLNDRFNLKSWLNSQRGVRVIILDMHWYEHTYGAVDFAQVCKKTMPWAYTVLGGLTASGFASEILESFPEVDFIIRGDAEEPLLILIQQLLASRRLPDAKQLADIPNLTYRFNDEVVENDISYIAEPEELDDLNFVALDFLEHYQEYRVHEYLVTNLDAARHSLAGEHPFAGRWLCTARGCRYECSYCGGCKSAHKKLAGRHGIIVCSPERVADALADLQAQKVEQAAMSFDIAELGEAYWMTLFGQMRQRAIHIGLYNEFFQLPDQTFIRSLAEAADLNHTCVALSPLSGNEQVRRLNGKHYANDAFFQILEELRAHKLYLYVYFSLNLPGETEETFEQTLTLARQVYDFYPRHLLKILNTVHTIDPHSPMNVDPEKYGIRSSMSSFLDFYNYCRETQLVAPAACTEEYRGFQLASPQSRQLPKMAKAWNAARKGREQSWWPIPPSW